MTYYAIYNNGVIREVIRKASSKINKSKLNYNSQLIVQFYFISIFILLTRRKAMEPLIHRVSNYPDLLPEMPRYCCLIKVLIKKTTSLPRDPHFYNSDTTLQQPDGLLRMRSAAVLTGNGLERSHQLYFESEEPGSFFCINFHFLYLSNCKKMSSKNNVLIVYLGLESLFIYSFLFHQ